MAFDGTILWSPPLNSIKFINTFDDSFLDTESLDALMNLDYMNYEGYCQKIRTGETRQIQFHANGTTPTVYVKDWDTDAIVSGPTVASSVATSVKEGEDLVDYPFDIYQASIFFPLNGRFYATIEMNAGVDIITSEPILVNDFLETALIKCYNDRNTDINRWNDGFKVSFRVEAQAFRLNTGSDRTIFKGSNNQSLTIAQKNKRGVRVDFYQLPPYTHEMLGYGLSMDTVEVDEQQFYSEEGYSSIEYLDRYSLANGTATLFTKYGFNQQFVTLGEGTFIVNDVGDFIVDVNDNNIIQGDG